MDELGQIQYNQVGNPIIESYEYFFPNLLKFEFWFITIFIILGVLIVTLLEKYGIQKKEH